MTRLRQDIRYAFRTFGKAPGFATVAVVVLALGVGANSAIFTIVNALLLRPLAGQADELVGLYNFDRTIPDSYRAFSYPNYVDIRERSGVFGGGLMAHTIAMVGVPAGDVTRRVFTSVVSSNYFDTLGVPLAAGRSFTAAEERPGSRTPVVIVNYARWREAGLSPDFIGRTIRINAQDFTVVGVAPEGFTGTWAMMTAEMWLPLGMLDVVSNDLVTARDARLDDRANHGLFLAGRLTPGIGDQVIQARLDALAGQLAEAHPAENKNLALSFQPLPRIGTSTHPRGNGPLGALMALFLALSGGTLLIACLNVANMLLARGTVRRKEIALRLALGASRTQVVRQMLTEGFLLAAGGATLGLVASYVSTTALASSLVSVLPLALEFDPSPDVRVLMATTLFAFASTVVFGLGPALKLSRRDLVSDLKEAAQYEGGRRFLTARNALVVAQVALSLALLTAGGLFARAAIVAGRTDPGFRYDRLLLASTDPTMAGATVTRATAIHRDVLDRVRRIPGVEAAGLSSTLPFGDFHERERIRRVGSSDAGEPPSATYRVVTPGYFASLGLRLLRGRDFTEQEGWSAGAPAVAIIDMALATKLFGTSDPIGQPIEIVERGRLGPAQKSKAFVVVGIAPPILEEVVDPGPSPHIYVPLGRHERGEMHLTVRAAQPGSEAALLQAVRGELRAADPRLPILALKTMQAFHEASLGLWMLRAGGYMFTLLGGLALVLAIVGVYGVRAYVVAQRTREFGIRMALGADASRVRRMVLGEGLGVAAVGVVLGLPLALLAAQAMASVLNRIGGFDPLVFAAAPALLGLAALVASYIPAHRATTIAPLSALRSE